MMSADIAHGCNAKATANADKVSNSLAIFPSCNILDAIYIHRAI
jgi:hypothetical protein